MNLAQDTQQNGPGVSETLLGPEEGSTALSSGFTEQTTICTKTR